ncbi:hypothetical protein [Nostoc sphaeroides]|uniref:hypothetical protein n=1 Tax=Nostoc sphaeroides TaxID=446679 RepID=UPI00226AABAC|nr:hypothetical protein [Nostoc sphaeroides]
MNLEGVDLAHASFISTGLSEPNLQNVDSYRAKLIQTQLNELILQVQLSLEPALRTKNYH